MVFWHVNGARPCRHLHDDPPRWCFGTSTGLGLADICTMTRHDGVLARQRGSALQTSARWPATMVFWHVNGARPCRHLHDDPPRWCSTPSVNKMARDRAAKGLV